MDRIYINKNKKNRTKDFSYNLRSQRNFQSKLGKSTLKITIFTGCPRSYLVVFEYLLLHIKTIYF